MRDRPWSARAAARSACILFAIALPACGASSTPDARTVVSDSAGVRIVDFGVRTDSTYRAAELVYRTGWEASDYPFDGIRDGAILEGGRVVIGDFGPRNVVTLTATGEVESVAGGSGEGPTEIGRLWALHLLDGDTVVVQDATNLRFTLYHDGDFVRGYNLERVFLSAIGTVGRNVLMIPPGFPVDFEEDWYSGPIVLHPLDTERFDTVAWFDMAARPNLNGPNDPFRPRGHIGSMPDQIVVARQDRPRVDLLDAGGAWTHSLRWTWEPTPIDDRVWADYARWRVDVLGETEEEAEQRVDRARDRAGSHLPAIGDVLADDRGRIWVADYTADRRNSRYWVTDVDGTELGWVEIPGGGRVLDIRGDLVLVSQEDALDVEAAVLFRLVEPDGPTSSEKGS